MQLTDIVQASRRVAATRSRKAKVAVLAEVLGAADAHEAGLVASYLSGSLRQRRTGLGWRGLSTLPPAADEATLGVLEVDEAFEAISRVAGPGSQAARASAVEALFGRATAQEQEWLRAVALGEVRQGALDALLQEAVAAAAGIELGLVRRAAMFSGSTVAVVSLALREGADALAAIGLRLGSPLLPMLASSAPDVAAALAKAAEGADAAIDAKLDGIRIQVHRDGDQVRIFTRSLEEITHRLPDVAAVAAGLRCSSAVLDGEALVLDPSGRPLPFQETASRIATAGAGVLVTPYFFDLLHLDGEDLLDRPAHERWARLDALVPAQHRVRRLTTRDTDAAERFLAGVLADGHEGVVVKSPGAAYDAGRRGSSWVKVKPVHTLDLVVLAVEWGSGRRQGLLSNIHLGARSDDGDGFVMLGKTFKGMTDEMLAWQTERFLELQAGRDGHVVHVRPEQVVEIAFDGLQRSPRYPGGLALRFARVVRYRDDKTADEADTMATVRSLAAGSSEDDASPHSS